MTKRANSLFQTKNFLITLLTNKFEDMKIIRFMRNDNEDGILVWKGGTCEAFIASGVCRKFKTLKGATKWLNKQKYFAED